MGEAIRFGDICGYDDAEVIILEDDVVLVIDNEGSEENADFE